MKIGFDAKRAFHNFRGLGNYSRTLISGLYKYAPNDELILFTPEFKDPKAKKWLKDFPRLKIRSPKGILNAFPSLWRSLFLARDLKGEGLDLYHGLSHEIPPFIDNLNCKKIVTIHDLLFLRYPENFPWIDRLVYKWKFSSSCNRADLVLAICEQTKRDIVEFLNIPEEKIKVIYQAINPVFYKLLNEEEKKLCRQKYFLPEKFILYVGALEANKNVMNLVKAYGKVKTELPLVIVGKGANYKKQLEKEISRLKIKDKVIFLDFVPLDDLPGIYQSGEIFVFPSFFEGFGLPIVESLFSCTPVITTKGSCFPEAGGHNTIYVDPHGPEQLCDAMQRVLKSPELQKEMAQKGLEYAQKFSLEQVSEVLRETYLKTLKKTN